MKVVVLQLLMIPEKHRAHIGILSTKARSLGGFFPPPKVNDTEISKSLSECLRTFHLAPSKTNSSEEERRGLKRRREMEWALHRKREWGREGLEGRPREKERERKGE